MTQSMTQTLPSALVHIEEIFLKSQGKPALFLDYDGTLTPIVSTPDLASLSASIREVLKELADTFVVAVVSGRDREDVEARIGLEGLYYGGSHGFDIKGPRGARKELPEAVALLPELDAVEKECRKITEEAVLIERKRFSLAIHFRNVRESRQKNVQDEVVALCKNYNTLKVTHGKKVIDIGPDLDWNKGKALLWIKDEVEKHQGAIFPIYIGDDLTDEEAFKVARGPGIAIVVRDVSRLTYATYALDSTREVELFLRGLCGKFGT